MVPKPPGKGVGLLRGSLVNLLTKGRDRYGVLSDHTRVHFPTRTSARRFFSRVIVGVPSGRTIPRDRRISRAPSYCGLPSTHRKGIGSNFKGLERRVFFYSTRLQVLITHLFPACCVHLRGSRENSITVEQDGIIFLARYGISEKVSLIRGRPHKEKLNLWWQKKTLRGDIIPPLWSEEPLIV